MEPGATPRRHSGPGHAQPQPTTRKRSTDSVGGPSRKIEAKTQGYRSAQGFALSNGYIPQEKINSCHLFPKQLGGDGTKRENLAACSRSANTYVTKGSPDRQEYPLFYYEKMAAGYVTANHTILYQVKPKYFGRRTVPYMFEVNMRAWDSSGNPLVLTLASGAPVLNDLDVSQNGSYNLGNQYNPGYNEVPLKGTP